MKLIIATSNKGKIKEIKEYCNEFDVIAWSDILDPFEIVEDGATFKENSIIKAKAVYDAIDDENVVVLADDSGISVDALDGKPGIYSARFAGVNASDKDNLYKLIEELKSKGLNESKAHYTAAMAIASKNGIQTVHGWMYGKVITTPRGTNGFGYDPIFIPDGFEKTLGELSSDVKKELSHRSQAIKLAKIVIKTILK